MKNLIKAAAASLIIAVSPINAQTSHFTSTPNTSTSPMSSVSHLWDTSDGSVGRLTIGSYSARLFASSSQSVVDAADSAAYISWGNIVMIADHASQGFSIIRSVGPGASATITDNSTITYLTCASTYQGYNTGNGVNLNDGTYAENVGDGSYILYTCNDSTGYSVTITYWNITGQEAAAPAYVEPTYEYSEPASVESSPVVDTTAVVEQTQPTQDEPTVTEPNVSSANACAYSEDSIPSNSVDESVSAAALFGTASTDIMGSSLSANKWSSSEVLSDTEKPSVYLKAAEKTLYYADNRRWSAIAGKHETEA